VARRLRYWLSTRASIRPGTLRAYTQHVEGHLIPLLGRFRLAELTSRQVTALFAALGAADTRYGRRPAPATLHRIRATLRAALNVAIRDGLLADNPARRVALPSPRRPQPRVWTAQRVQAWQRSGQRLPVAVKLGVRRPWRVPDWTLRPIPYLHMIMTTSMRVSNAKAKRELGWAPAVPTYREGIPLAVRASR
jgi:site-specific recombinase XerD